jgi:hypothetical protein
MKITESKIKRLIKYSLMHEVVDLATGNTQFDTVRFAKCEKIEMPPVFRQIFFDKAFGQSPAEMRKNITVHLRKQMPGNSTTAEEWAQRISGVLNPESMDMIFYYLNEFANIAGVPAVFCKFLQMAIDEAGDILELFYDSEKEDSQTSSRDMSSIMQNHIKDALSKAVQQSRIETTNLGLTGSSLRVDAIKVNKEYGSIDNPKYSSMLFLYTMSNTLNVLAVNKKDSYLPDVDTELLAALENDYQNYSAFLSDISRAINRMDKNVEIEGIFNVISGLVEEILNRSHSLVKAEKANISYAIGKNLSENTLVTSFKNNLQGLGERQSTDSKRQVLVDFKKLIQYIMQLSLMHVVRHMPNMSKQPNFREYFKNNPKSLGFLNSFSGQILR